MYDPIDDRDEDDIIPHVTFRLLDHEYAISAAHVRSMLELPEVTRVPHAPPFVRGIINLRGQTLPLVDLRARLGLRSVREDCADFDNLLARREQDHRNWLAALDDAVAGRRPFDLETDPHACAFGRWYDAFTSDDLAVLSIVRKFDRPHRRIHAVAIAAAAALKADDRERAGQIVAQAREKDFGRLIELFAQSREIFRNGRHETALVVETGRYTYGLAVDAVTAVETFDEDRVLPNPVGHTGEVDDDPVIAMGRRTGGDEVVQILAPDRICRLRDLTGTTPQPAA